MGIKDKMMEKVAERQMGKAGDTFKRIIKIQESMHAYLEHMLERLECIENQLRKSNGEEELKVYKYKEQ